jgi:hypothetical protein
MAKKSIQKSALDLSSTWLERGARGSHSIAGDLATATARIRERYTLRLGDSDATLARFFKYVPQALVRDGDDVTVVNVAASYIPAGHHLRLFLAYPYFGDSTLEHDPSLGLESLPTLVTSDLVLVLVGSASVIAIVVLAVRWKRKTVNIVGTR